MTNQVSVERVETVEAAERSLPATRTESGLAPSGVRQTQRHQPVSVAYLPLALVAFIILGFAMALWTFLAATT